jgi:hypothetical protein
MEIEQYQLPGMPDSVEPKLDQAEEFLAAVRKYGPLVNVSIAARILGVTDGSLNTVVSRGLLTKLHFFGNSPFFVLSEIELRKRSPRSKGGRPKKAA